MKKTTNATETPVDPVEKTAPAKATKKATAKDVIPDVTPTKPEAKVTKAAPNTKPKKAVDAPKTPVDADEKTAPVKATKKPAANLVIPKETQTKPDATLTKEVTKTQPKKTVAAPETPVVGVQKTTPAKATKKSTAKPVAAKASKTIAKAPDTVKAAKTTVADEIVKAAPVVEAEQIKPEPKLAAAEIDMLERIGLTAGVIWHYLAEHGATPVAKLVYELPEEESIIQRSIGWLAQEDKIKIFGGDQVETIILNA